MNVTFKPVSTSPLDRRITNRLLHHSNEVNHLSELIHGENLNIRRAQFPRIEVARLEFLQYCADRVNEDRDFQSQITIAFDTLDYQKYQIEI